MFTKNIRAGLFLFGIAALIVACDQSSEQTMANSPRVLPNHGAISELRQRQIAFLDRIRASDPDHRTIDRALLNPQNELGLVLDRTVPMEKIPDLMRTMLGQMAREFPSEDLTVLAYAPSTPPRKIGTAHFNAHTREMTYQPD